MHLNVLDVPNSYRRNPDSDVRAPSCTCRKAHLATSKLSAKNAVLKAVAAVEGTAMTLEKNKIACVLGIVLSASASAQNPYPSSVLIERDKPSSCVRGGGVHLTNLDSRQSIVAIVTATHPRGHDVIVDRTGAEYEDRYPKTWRELFLPGERRLIGCMATPLSENMRVSYELVGAYYAPPDVVIVERSHAEAFLKRAKGSCITYNSHPTKALRFRTGQGTTAKYHAVSSTSMISSGCGNGQHETIDSVEFAP